MENLILIRYFDGVIIDYRKYEFFGYFLGKFGLEILLVEFVVKLIFVIKVLKRLLVKIKVVNINS